MSAVWGLVVFAVLVATLIVYAGRPTRARKRWSGDTGGDFTGYPLEGDASDSGHHGGHHADAAGGHGFGSVDSGGSDGGSSGGDGGGGD